MASLTTGSSVPKTWTDTTVKAGNTYEYRVAGKNSKGQSGWSNVVEQYTRAIPPTNVKATLVTTTSAKVTWSQSGQGALRTYFERRVDTGSGWEQWQSRFAYADAWAGSWTDTSIPAGARVQYRAWTVPSKVASWINDAALQSAYSEASNILASLQPPNAPSNLAPNGTVVAVGEPVRLTWVHNPVDTTEQTAAEVQWKWGPQDTWHTIAVGENSYATLDAGSSHYPIQWRVRTRGQHADFGPWSAIAQFDVVDRPGVAVTTPEGDTWDTPELDVAWSFYQAQYRPQSAWNAELLDNDRQVIEELQGSGATTSKRFSTRIENGVTYVVRVRAATWQIWSDWAEQTFTATFLPPELPELVGSWDEDMGAHTLAVVAGDKSGSDKPETVRIDLWRSVDQGATWELVAEGLSTDAVVSDWEGLSLGDTQYRAVAWTHAGANAETVLIIPADSAAIWLGAGSKYEDTARLPYNPEIEITAGRERSSEHYEGRALPVAYAGEHLSRSVKASGLIINDEPENAARVDLERVAHASFPIHLYRDPAGNRIYGTLSTIPATSRWGKAWEWSFTLDETEH
nr:hypothetical protein [Scrofimicrobium canadense]